MALAPHVQVVKVDQRAWRMLGIWLRKQLRADCVEGEGGNSRTPMLNYQLKLKDLGTNEKH
jgi:hypothetical protein